MKHLLLVGLFAGLLFITSTLKSQETPVNITVDTLSKDVYMLTGQGGNIGIYTGDTYVLMIDNQFERISKENKAARQLPQEVLERIRIQDSIKKSPKLKKQTLLKSIPK